MKNEQIAVIVEKVQKDKNAHFDELYEATWNTVYYYCYKLLNNEHDAKDAMQTVFIELYKKFDTLHHPNAFNSFLATIMRFTCANYHRAKVRTATDDIDDHDTILPEDNSEFLPSAAFEKEEVRREIAKLVEALPEKQREAILLFYFEEKTIKEIAEITESKFDAVNNRLVTARKTLRERVEELIKEGIMDRTMAILPIPILTRILLDDMAHIARPEIGQNSWPEIADSINIPVQPAATPPAAATATAATTGINAGIIATCVALVATGVILGYYVHDTFISTPPVEAYYQTASMAVDGAVNFEILIPTITNRVEFVEFTDAHGFRFLGGSRTSHSGGKMLYYLHHGGDMIYLGYAEDLYGGFRVAHQVTDGDAPRVNSDGVGAWFAQHMR